MDVTDLDAAKSGIVFATAKNVSSSAGAVRRSRVPRQRQKLTGFGKATVSFLNQALKGVSQNFQVDLLPKYQAVTKEEVLAALEKHVLPLFDAASSVALVVAAPSKADAVAESLTTAGFKVQRRTLEVDPSELEGSESSGGESSEESEEDK